MRTCLLPALTIALLTPPSSGSAAIPLAEGSDARAVIVADRYLVDRSPVAARFVRLENYNAPVVLSEIQVFDVDGRNVADGCKTSARMKRRGDTSHTNLVDGVIGGQNQCGTHNRGRVWVELDLGAEVQVAKLVIHNTDLSPRSSGTLVGLLDAERNTLFADTLEDELQSWTFDRFQPRPPGPYDTRLPIAIDDLKHYLDLVTGADFTVKAAGTERDDDTCIYVGPCAAARLGYVKNTLSDDQWMIRTRDGDLYLFGGNGFGDSRAVWHFLEDIVGVRWWNWDEESVPRRPTLTVPPCNRGRTPPFLYVDNQADSRGFTTLNHLRNGLVKRNARYAFAQPPAGRGDFSLIREINQYEGNQIKKNPQWFARDKQGEVIARPYRRGLSHGGFAYDLCYANAGAELVALLARSVNRTLKGYKDWRADFGVPQRPMLMVLCQDDATPLCECQRCRQAYKQGGGDLWVRFFNEVAAGVKAEHPDVTIWTQIGFTGVHLVLS